MFKGPKPAAQPRSLRSITESKTRGAGFMPEPDYNTQGGVPLVTPGVQGTYEDSGNHATFGPHGGQTPSGSPFANMKKGR